MRQLGQPPDFDTAAADALAVVTLLTSGRPRDAQLAGRLLDELLAEPNGQGNVIQGLASVCAGLLALLEFYGRIPPDRGLQDLGRLIAEATAATRT